MAYLTSGKTEAAAQASSLLHEHLAVGGLPGR